MSDQRTIVEQAVLIRELRSEARALYTSLQLSLTRAAQVEQDADGKHELACFRNALERLHRPNLERLGVDLWFGDEP